MQAEHKLKTPGTIDLAVSRLDNQNIHSHNLAMLERKVAARDGIVMTELDGIRGRHSAVSNVSGLQYNVNGRVVYPPVENIGLRSASFAVEYCEDDDGMFHAMVAARRSRINDQFDWSHEDDFGESPGENILLDSVQLFLNSYANGEYRR